MADTATLDYASVVLLCRVVGAGYDLLKLSDNARYELNISPSSQTREARWWHHAHEDNDGPILVLLFNSNMYCAEGWYFGSVCRQSATFQDRDQSCQPLAEVDQYITKCVRSNDMQMVELEKSRSMDIRSSFLLDLGAVRVQVWRPVLDDDEQRRYIRHAEKFSNDFLQAMPQQDQNFERGEAETFVQRFGRGNTVYRRCGFFESTGSFASVVKVIEDRSGKHFAAKIPHYKSNDSAARAHERWELLNTECERMAGLVHPHVAKVVEVLTTAHIKQPPWLIIEWIENDLSSTRLEDGDIPVLLKQITSGLEFIHRQGFTHRDLKPASILLQLAGARLVTAKLADFGSSASTAKMYTYTGTSVYMAPELFRANAGYDSAVDLWSLGVIALELLTRWSASDHAWHAACPPSGEQHHCWVLEHLRPRATKVQRPVRPLLDGLLEEQADARWTAAQAERWLGSSWELVQDTRPDAEDVDEGRVVMLQEQESNEMGQPLRRSTRQRLLREGPSGGK